MNEPISRFTGKARAYASGRPIYPAQTLIQILQVTNLAKSASVFDLGAGTGLFSELLLTHFDHVNLVEPNPDMLTVAAERLPADRITIHPHQAESFSAQPQSIDLITAAQAFHWFDQTTAKQHWKAVLTPEGFVALIWNERTTASPFAKSVADLLKSLAQRDPDKAPPLEHPDEEILAFFSSAQVLTTEHTTPLSQLELTNLVLSRSYSPVPSDSDYAETISKIHEIFKSHQLNGLVPLPYRTKLFIGRL